jgi:acyl carrier protein
MTGRRMVAATLAAGTLLAAPCLALPPLPLSEIVDTVRGLAAEQIGIKKADLDVTRSLAAQGLSENGLHALVITIQDEFGVVIPDDELRNAKSEDPVRVLSVQRLAEMVVRHTPPNY